MKNNVHFDSDFPLHQTKGIKGLVKRAVRKSTLFLLKPFADFQNEVHEAFAKELSEYQKETELHLSKLQADLGAAARQIMLVKWREIDSRLKETETEDDILTCNICGHAQRRGDYETKETECIFNGGHLVRYVCPECGVVFGPTKFVSQGQKGIDEDYWVHYLGFSEGDSSYKETRAFHMLNPTKEGIYLNYGCGHWSKSLQNLRNEGYQVYGYEPYSPDIDNPYMITSREQLCRMRFDGIYSNDLLEHLIDPVEDMKFMSTLLFGKESRMAHCTACYTYKYEYTRFHTHFFLGNSVQVLCERSGLKITDYCNDMQENDFICYVYGINYETVDFLDKMLIKNDGAKRHDGIVMNQNGILYGPYFTLPQRDYTLVVCVEGTDMDANICVNADCGKTVFCEAKLQSGENRFTFRPDQMKQGVEFVISNHGSDMLVKEMYFA